MRTEFSLARLADPNVAEANRILRTCVHCGFCTATCPTYVLLGDELDSPRGRIYLIKNMLEHDKPATPKVVKHIDRCLSCLSCMTTCPSGVDYMHLVDRARAHIHETYERPKADRWLRSFLAWLVPNPTRFRLATVGGMLARPLAPLIALIDKRLGAMVALAPRRLPGRSSVDRPQVFPAEGPRRARMALLTGCAQQVLAPQINESTIRLLTRHGVEVVVAKGVGCCGALVHHMGRETDALESARANVAAWTAELEGEGLDAIAINASGCGTTVKDYGHMLSEDPNWAERAARISALTKDITEIMTDLGLGDRIAGPAAGGAQVTVAYHSACSMQHGQQLKTQPKALLTEAGFAVKDVPEGHLCCGSAGTYNLLQPEIATRLRDRKLANIAKTEPDLIATGNIGCMGQLSSGTRTPIVHTAELLDWVTGGPSPDALRGRGLE